MATLKDVTLLSEVEQLVLLAVLKLDEGGDAYAVPLRALILKDTGIDLPRGSVYVTLERLEQKGLIHSTMTEPTAVKGGKSRRVFGLRPAGMTALRVATRAMQRMVAGTSLAKG
ncbi:MAG: helix-turn-helix transcriptional regulator [Acidobacteria bacterium]|nr:helix-turn-helix transcriptional regulator [Acidobacteriota bacterium]MBP8273525.1 helix-turn-helix transcriptional regulator [Acidobacteriota bacterium]